MIWKDKEINTVGDIADAIYAILNSPDPKAEGAAFMDLYRAANTHADDNIGYVIGYMEPADVRDLAYKVMGVYHPVFRGAL